MKRTIYLIAIAALLPLGVSAQPGSAPPAPPRFHDPMPMAPGPGDFRPQLSEPPEPLALDFGAFGASVDDGDLMLLPPPPPPGPPQEGQLPPPPPKKPDPKKVAELRERILQFKYERMKKAVAMDDETWEKFFKIYKPAETDIESVVKQRNEEMKKLGQMMNGAKTDADVDPEMQKIRDLNKKIEDRVSQLNEDLKPVLSPRQRARLLVFEHEFNSRLREQIAKRRGEKAPPISKEERKLRQQKMREWWMKNHPAKRDAIDGKKAPDVK